jgi:hypothetical protein
VLLDAKATRPTNDRRCGAHEKIFRKDGPGNARDESSLELATAVLAERDAHERLRAARAHLAALVRDAVVGGALYDEVARISIRATTGRSGTLAERRREIDRLRHVVRRHSETACHGEPSRKFENAPPAQARSEDKENIMEKLIKRTTIEETFAVEDKARDLGGDDRDEDIEVDDDDEGDEDDAAARKARRK